jgi:prepilin-type N-terminal cleavage/methylation domain-containing protein
MKRKAFSLLELLVVIGLIATLAAMLFPVFSQVREKSRSSVCISNLRQIGASIAMYSQDYDNIYPYGADVIDKFTNAWGVNPVNDPILSSMPLLTDILKPYINEKKLWKCPSDVGFKRLDHGGVNGQFIDISAQPTAFDQFNSSYVYRTEIAFRKKMYPLHGWRENAEVGPSDMLIISDMTSDWHSGGNKSPVKWWNCLMADGRVAHLSTDRYVACWTVDLNRE